MPSSESQSADTRSRILDAAESLIAEKGFRAFSLREVTRAAGANLAAVNYHFGSRDGLVGEVLARVIEPINQQRLRLLDEAEARHGDRPVPVEEILEALHRPVVDRMKSSPHETPVYLRLAGRCLAESSEHPQEALVDLFREVISRFLAAAAAALPDLDPTSLFWRMHLSVGTMIFALTHADRLPAFSEGRVETTDPEDTLRRLIEFTAAGLRGSGAEGAAAGEVSAKAPARPRRRPTRPLATLGAAALLLLPACRSLSPDGATGLASVEVPAHWVAGPSWTPTSHPDHAWISSFGSRELSAYVESVLSGNRDLKAARARIETARANAAIIGADLYPQVQGGFSAQRDLQNFIGLPIPGTPPGSVLSTRFNRFGLALNLSWELDLWGRIRAAKSAAVAEFEASDFDRATAELSLAGQGAKTWFALAEARDQVALARATIAAFSETERAIRERFERGVEEEGRNSAAQLLLASGDVATAREALAARQDLEGRTARLLELLAGEYPAGRAGSGACLPEMPGKVPTGLPASLLDRRPDLAATERRLAAADKRLLEAKRSLLPAISLTSSFGSASQEIGDLLKGDFSIWSLAGNVAQPLLQGGRLRANVKRRGSEVEIAAAEFEQAALTAFSEVENALASEQFLNRRVEALGDASRLAEAAYRRSLEEFRAGTGDILTVLASQQRLFTTRSQLLAARRERLDNRIDLHLALGGDFRPLVAASAKALDPSRP
jgi:multidrug efflux system outer membrane protein